MSEDQTARDRLAEYECKINVLTGVFVANPDLLPRAFERLFFVGADKTAPAVTPTPEQPQMSRIAPENEGAAALECLRLAASWSMTPEETVATARSFYDFVAGTDRTGLADKVEATVDELAR